MILAFSKHVTIDGGQSELKTCQWLVAVDNGRYISVLSDIRYVRYDPT